MNTRKKLKKELLQYYILQVLNDQNSDCAQIYRTVKTYIKIRLSALYKALQALEEEGKIVSYIDDATSERKKIYCITPRGESYIEACAYEIENKQKLYQRECKVVRFWAGFAMGLFFLLWFPLFAVAFWLTLAFSIVFCAFSLVAPTALAAAFGYLGFKVLSYTFTVGMAEGLVTVLINLLFVLGAVVVCFFWLWVMTRFVKFAFRASGKLFRGLFKFISISGL